MPPEWYLFIKRKKIAESSHFWIFLLILAGNGAECSLNGWKGWDHHEKEDACFADGVGHAANHDECICRSNGEQWRMLVSVRRQDRADKTGS